MVFFLVGLLGCSSDKPKQAKEAELHSQLAQNLLNKGEATQALAELLRAEQLDPKNPEIQNLLGLAYSEKDLLDDAERCFRKAVELDKDYSEARNHLCAVFITRGRYDDGIAECSKAVENVLYATPERAYHNMGYAYEKKGNVPKAIESYQKGLIHNRNFVLSRKALADIYTQQKKYPQAKAELENARKACEASPKGAWGTACPDSLYLLGMTYVKLKQRASAAEVFKECMKSDEEGDYGKKCRDNLKALE